MRKNKCNHYHRDSRIIIDRKKGQGQSRSYNPCPPWDFVEPDRTAIDAIYCERAGDCGAILRIPRILPFQEQTDPRQDWISLHLVRSGSKSLYYRKDTAQGMAVAQRWQRKNNNTEWHLLWTRDLPFGNPPCVFLLRGHWNSWNDGTIGQQLQIGEENCRFVSWKQIEARFPESEITIFRRDHRVQKRADSSSLCLCPIGNQQRGPTAPIPCTGPGIGRPDHQLRGGLCEWQRRHEFHSSKDRRASNLSRLRRSEIRTQAVREQTKTFPRTSPIQLPLRWHRV